MATGSRCPGRRGDGVCRQSAELGRQQTVNRHHPTHGDGSCL